MVLHPNAPSTDIIEFATSSAFGMQAIGKLVFFDPCGWDPLQGIDQALDILGWESTQVIAATEEEAQRNLTSALKSGPVLVGPVEMGLLKHQPSAKGPIGADHYVVALCIADGMVEFHDPAGYPFAMLPVEDFLKSWSTRSLGYGKPYTMRYGFKQRQQVSPDDAIRRAMPYAKEWLAANPRNDVPSEAKANREAAQYLADTIELHLTPDIKAHLVFFAVQVGTRRSADAATCLARLGYGDAAKIMGDIARKIGALQHLLVVGDVKKAAALLRELAPMYAELEIALE